MKAVNNNEREFTEVEDLSIEVDNAYADYNDACKAGREFTQETFALLKKAEALEFKLIAAKGVERLSVAC